jgi:uncharacterized membrane protein
MKNNFVHTFTTLLKQLQVPVTESTAITYLESHPDEGSMLAYADALNHFQIENAAIRIDQEQLLTLPTPFIAFSHVHGGTFSIVKQISQNTIEWFDTQTGWVSDKIEDFTKTWSGVVLLAEKDEKSGEKNYSFKRNAEFLQKIRVPAAIILIVILLLALIIQMPSFSDSIIFLLFLKLVGMVISTLLFVKSIDNGNSLVNKLCTAGAKISCQSILDSPGAKITSWFSWSDAGFIYFFGSFAGTLISLFFLDSFEIYWSIQMIFSASALIFSIYSLYYQVFKAKMYCTLCLGVVAVFLVESFLTFIKFPNFIFQFGSYFNIFLGFLIPLSFLLMYKNILIKSFEGDNFEKELIKLKVNPEVFETLIRNQRPLPFVPSGIGVVSIGNLKAQNTLLIVSNPLCTPCSKLHLRIEKVLQTTQDLKVQIIFYTDPNGNDSGGKFVRKVLSLKPELQQEAILSWMQANNKNYEKWNKPYQQFSEKDISKIWQKDQYSWASNAEIKRTPALFFNNVLLPNIIKVEEIGRYINVNKIFN